MLAFSLIVSVLTKRHVGDESLLSIKPCEVHCVHNGVSHNVHSAFWIISNKLGHSGSEKTCCTIQIIAQHSCCPFNCMLCLIVSASQINVSLFIALVS